MRSTIDQRLDKLEAALEQQRPAVLTITLKDGTRETVDPATVWDFFKIPERRHMVESITASRDDYSELAGLVEALCKP